MPARALWPQHPNPSAAFQLPRRFPLQLRTKSMGLFSPQVGAGGMGHGQEGEQVGHGVGQNADGMGHGMGQRRDRVQEGQGRGWAAEEVGHRMGCRQDGQDGMQSVWDTCRTGRGQVDHGQDRMHCPPCLHPAQGRAVMGHTGQWWGPAGSPGWCQRCQCGSVPAQPWSLPAAAALPGPPHGAAPFGSPAAPALLPPRCPARCLLRLCRDLRGAAQRHPRPCFSAEHREWLVLPRHGDPGPGPKGLSWG